MRNGEDKAKRAKGLTEEEIAAMKERIEELNADRKDGKAAALSKIEKMPEPDRTLARRIHVIITSAAPDLSPRTWYGMPAYSKGDKVICFFQNASKFKARYSTLGFSDKANLDDGDIWPTTFAIKRLGQVGEKRIAALVKRAVN